MMKFHHIRAFFDMLNKYVNFTSLICISGIYCYLSKLYPFDYPFFGRSYGCFLPAFRNG